MTTPRIYWLQAQGAAAAPQPRVYWMQVTQPATVVAPDAPGTATGAATGATTATISVTDTSGGTASHRVQVRPVGGTFVDATGATNPMPPGTLSFAATGLASGVEHEARVRAERAGLDSTYVVSSPWFQQLAVGGGGELPTDITAPLLVGSIAITALSSTGYTATCPAGSDAGGVTVYQWRINGGTYASIPAGGRAITITGRTPASTDVLEMRCGDAAGNFSAPLSLSVTLLGIAPTVTTQPTAQSVTEGQLATFTAAFAGTPAPTIQWFRNGVAIPGAVSATYSFTTALGDNGFTFYARGTNSAGAVNTNTMSLTVAAASAPGTPASFTLQPASQSVVAGATVTLAVAVTGTAPISVQWRRGGVAIPGATGVSYSFVAQLSDTGAVFDAVATGFGSPATSASATVTVSSAPVFAVTTFDAALDRILPYANGCPDQTAIFHLRQAAIEFFQRTLAWRQRLTPISTVVDQDTYGFVLPAGSVLAKVQRYEYDGQEREVVGDALGQSLAVNQSSNDAVWTQDRLTFTVTPVPAEAGKLMTFHVALKPSQAATGIPAAQWEQYIHYIAYGALAGVLDIPSQPFTNPALAAVWRDKFEEAVSRVGAAGSRGYARTNQRVRGHFF